MHLSTLEILLESYIIIILNLNIRYYEFAIFRCYDFTIGFRIK